MFLMALYQTLISRANSLLKRLSSALSPRLYGLSWEFPGAKQPLVGLVKLQLTLQTRFKKRIATNIELCSDNGANTLRSLSPNKHGYAQVYLALHTHLLTNGQHWLDLRILDAEGRCLSTQRIHFLVGNYGELAATVANSMHRKEVPLFTEGPCDATHYDYEDPDLTPWFDRPDALETIAARETAGELTSEEADHFRHFVTHGFIVLKGMLDEPLLQAIDSEVDDAIAKGYNGYEYGSSQRLEHLHRHYPNINKLFFDRRYLDLLDKLYRAKAIPCQTLTYVFGSQQDAHQDTVHLTPFPAGYMCGVWIALQDVLPNSGELVVYPGSHRLPRIYMHRANCAKIKNGDWKEFGEKVVGRWKNLLEEHHFTPETYRAKRGDVLIWHENLMHAGSVRLDQSLPRRSIVIHTFADGAVVYYDSSGEVGQPAHPNEL